MRSLRRCLTSSPSTKASPRDEVEAPSLLDLYRIALDEYRFQINLNWSRTQYYIVLNLGLLGLATGFFKLEDRKLSAVIGAGLYLAGVVCCVFSLVAGRVQHSYYRQIRDHKKRLEGDLALGDLAIRTTPGMGSAVRRLGRVTTFTAAMLWMVLLLDLGGLGYSVWALDGAFGWDLHPLHWARLA